MKNILLAVDGSDNSLRAAEEALKLLKLNHNLKVTAVNVGPSCYDLFPEPGVCAWIEQSELDKEVEARAARVFEKVADIFKREDLPVDVVLLKGNAADAICRYAKEGGYDLVVVGSRGFGELKGIILGSVSHKILHCCECPVMVVK